MSHFLSDAPASAASDDPRADRPSAVGHGRLLVLGGGAVVRECFAPAIAALGLSSVTTIVDPRASASTFRQPLTLVADDFRSVLKTAAAQGTTHCVVALPNALHHEAVSLALRSGLHVLCEKPLSLNASECANLAAQAARANRILAVNMVRRLYHSVQTAVDLLGRGWIGKLRAVRVAHGGRYGWPVASLAPFQRENGGVLADMGVHYLDLTEWIAGPLTPKSYEDDWAGGVESDCTFRLEGSNGVTVEIALSRCRPLANEVELEGESGCIRFGVDAFDACTIESVAADGRRSAVLVRPEGEDDDHRFEDYFLEQMRRFLGGADASELVDARAAGRAAGLIEWAYGHRADRRRSPAWLSPVTLEAGSALVTGATGFIGAHLLERLAADGRTEIVAGYHTLRGCARISRFPVQYAHVNLLDAEDVRRAVRGQRYVFHLAVSKAGGDDRAVTVQGTQHVVDAAIAERVETVVVLSTMYVMGRPGGTVDESAPYRPIGGAYGRTKAEMEQWCLERARSSATRIVVLLPTCVYGEGASTYTEMPVAMASEGRFTWIDDGAGLANIVYAANLVDAMIRAAIVQDAHGQRFIVNDEILTWREFLSPMLGPWLESVPAPSAEEFRAMTAAQPAPGVRDVIAAVMRSREMWDAVGRTRMANRLRPIVKRHLPVVSRMRARASSPSPRKAPAPRPSPPEWLAEVYGLSSTRFSSDRARTVLGWAPLMSREAALRRTTRWLEEQGLYEGAPGRG